MKKVMVLLAVAALATASGCCCTPSTGRMCPLCPCNWFSRPAPVCPPTYVAPVAAAQVCPPPCAPACPAPCSTIGTVSPMAASAMPQLMAPPAAPMVTQSQPMFFQSPMPAACCSTPEPTCGFAAPSNCGYAEPSCAGPFMSGACYGPFMDCNPCGGCGGCGGYDAGFGGCSGCGSTEGGAPATTTTPEKFVEPTPGGET